MMKQKTFILILTFLLCLAGSVHAQGPVKPKLCSTCGKMYVNCPYKGNHPKCATCGKLKEKCAYKGNHPKCSVCGKVKDNCPYKGNHPKCVTCGKLKDACAYKGDHPKCSTCAKYIGASSNACPYDGKHPVQKPQEPEELSYELVEKKPHFPGDNGNMQVMAAWMGQNMRYPVIAQELGIQGTVHVTFVVGKDGSILNPTVTKSVDKYLDAEALRLVKAMPKWVPGSQNGKPVSVQLTLPIRFQLQ